MPEEIKTIKTKGVYTLTVERSDQVKDVDEQPILVYCVTNTVTLVREWEDTLVSMGLSYMEQLSDVWDESVAEKPKIVVAKVESIH